MTEPEVQTKVRTVTCQKCGHTTHTDVPVEQCSSCGSKDLKEDAQ